MSERRGPERRIRVLVVDDQALFREALVALLAVQAGIEVVGEAANGKEAVEAVDRLRPDVVLMDLRMPVLDGVGATRRLHADHPRVRVLALTTFDGDAEVFPALRAGAVGYLLKDATTERLVEAVRRGRPGRVGAGAVGRGQARRPGRRAARAGAGPRAAAAGRPAHRPGARGAAASGRGQAATGRSPGRCSSPRAR